MSAIQNVLLLGADGTLGPAILHALTQTFSKITVLKRSTSKSPDTHYPPGVTTIRIPDAFTLEDLTSVFKREEIDAVVLTIKGSQVDLQKRVARACVDAGVKRLIPADFGSCDSSSPWARELVPLFERKTELREFLMELASASESSGSGSGSVASRSGEEVSFSWTALVCGHFADWSPEFLHVYIPERRIEIIDDGAARFSLSTLSRIGEATVAVLQNLETTRNKMVFVQSFSLTQMDLVHAFEKATGGEKWRVDRFEAKEYEKQEKAKADVGDLEAVENLVWLLGTLDGDWTKKEGFGMELLGLKDEGLDKVVKRIIDQGTK